MQVSGSAAPDLYVAKKLQDISRLSNSVPPNIVDQTRITENAKLQNNNPHNGYAAGVAAEAANGNSQSELAKIAEFTAGKSSLPPAGWRQAGTAQLSTTGIRGDNISSLSGKEFAQVFVSGSGETQRLAVQFTKQSGHWQQWLKDGGNQLGPSASESLAQTKFVEQLSTVSGAEVHVIDDIALPKSELGNDASYQSLIWNDANPAAMAFMQDAGRQSHIHATVFQ